MPCLSGSGPGQHPKLFLPRILLALRGIRWFDAGASQTCGLRALRCWSAKVSPRSELMSKSAQPGETHMAAQGTGNKPAWAVYGTIS